MKNRILKPGDIIPLTEEDLSALHSFNEEMVARQAAFDAAGSAFGKAHASFWNVLVLRTGLSRCELLELKCTWDAAHKTLTVGEFGILKERDSGQSNKS